MNLRGGNKTKQLKKVLFFHLTGNSLSFSPSSYILVTSNFIFQKWNPMGYKLNNWQRLVKLNQRHRANVKGPISLKRFEVRIFTPRLYYFTADETHLRLMDQEPWLPPGSFPLKQSRFFIPQSLKCMEQLLAKSLMSTGKHMLVIGS